MATAIKPILLLLSFAAAEVIALALPNSTKHQASAHPYFAILLALITAIYFIGVLISHIKSKKEPNINNIKPLFYRAPFVAGVILFLNILNIMPCFPSYIFRHLTEYSERCLKTMHLLQSA